MTITEEKLYLDVDKSRLLLNIPAFFSSFEESLAELTQNAYRSGAARLDIYLDLDKRELTVIDDGKGCADPRNMLTAGRSGWGNGVVDPAGLGLFALLGMSESVTIESKARNAYAWRITIDKECFDRGLEVRKEDIAWEGMGSETGTKIHAMLGPTANLNRFGHSCGAYEKANALKFRHYFPLDVSLTVIEKGNAERKKLNDVDRGTEVLTTPVGTLRKRSASNTVISILWEHRNLENTCVWSDLEPILRQSREGRLVLSLFKGRYFWEIDPNCKVRPKLPDRREVIKDAAYNQALEALAAALIENLDLPRIEAAAARIGKPAILTNPHGWISQLVQETRSSPLFNLTYHSREDTYPLPLALGYSCCAWQDVTEDSYYDDRDDGIEIERGPERSLYALNPLRVRSTDLAHALCQAEIPAIVSAGAPDVEFHLPGLKLASSCSAWIGVAEAIEIRQDGKTIADLTELTLHGANVPELEESLPEDCDPDDEESILIKVGEPHELLDWVREETIQKYLLHSLYETGNLDRYWEDEDLDEGALHRQLELDLLGRFFPATRKAQARWNALKDFTVLVQSLRRDTDSLLYQTRSLLQEYPELAPECERFQSQIALVQQLQFPLKPEWEPRQLEEN